MIGRWKKWIIVVWFFNIMVIIDSINGKVKIVFNIRLNSIFFKYICFFFVIFCLWVLLYKIVL